MELPVPETMSGHENQGDVPKSAGKPKFAKTTTKKLKDWYASHSDHPYPTEEEKETLKERTGLSVRQISRWFVNARRRGNVIPREGLQNSPVPASIPIFNPSRSSSWRDMNPLDRWRNSPPEEDAAPISAIAQAAADAPSIPSNPTFGHYAVIDEYHGIARSVSSLGTSNSVGSSDSSVSGSSAYSHVSASSLNSLDAKFGRRRRKTSNNRASPLSRSRSEAKKSRIYQCTFCTDTFMTKYDWTRHEGTLHLSLENWVCSPFGPTYQDPNSELEHCAFCDMVNPDPSHIQSHGFHECNNRALLLRTFSRKDHLRQHLRHTHNIQDILPSMSSWGTKVTQIYSRCGFCGERFSLWADRNDHLAEHFQAGTLMKEWQGDRGLSSHVALLVENAIPPYLIGFEATAVEPFSASRRASQMRNPKTGDRDMPTMYEALTAHLSEYVRALQEKYIAVTDDMLRKEARLFMFGDDDPWNQTAADNYQWLDLFKKGHGLDAPLMSPGIGLEASFSPGPKDPLSPASESMQDFISTITLHGIRVNPLQGRREIGSQWCTPWAWQSPECLAQFRAMCQMTSAAEIAEFATKVKPTDTSSLAPDGIDLNLEIGVMLDKLHPITGYSPSSQAKSCEVQQPDVLPKSEGGLAERDLSYLDVLGYPYRIDDTMLPFFCDT